MKRYINERKNIYGSESESREEKNIKANILREQLISEIDSEIIGFSTLYRLLSSIEDKENSQIKNLLLEILYLCGNKSFNSAVIQSKDEILQLVESGTDINLFNIGFKITKKEVNSQIEA